MCDTQCHKDGFKYDDIASDDGEPPTKHLCKCVDNLTQDEKELRVNGQQWSCPVAERRSRGKFSAGLGSCGLEIPQVYAAKMSNCRSYFGSC